MRRIFHTMLLVCACTFMFSCTQDNEDEAPQVLLSDISGVWQQTAYLCSDGYFVPIYGLDAIHYEFARPDTTGALKYTQYTLDELGNKVISKEGIWEYDPQTQNAHIVEPQGWNLDIHFIFGEKNNATLEIKGKTVNSNSTVKVKRLTK